MRLPVYEFAKHVDEKIESFIDEVFLLRNTPEAKKYIEEYNSISRLALSLNASGLKVEVECTKAGAEADGIIYISGWKNKELKVQVTHLFNYESSLRMELLNESGCAPMAGSIKRNKVTKKIEAEYGSVNLGQHIQDLANALIPLVNAKCEKKYTTKMVLLVSFSECKLLGFSGWSNLFNIMKNEIENAKSVFSELYFFNEESNEIQKA